MQTLFTKDQIQAAFMALDPAAQDAVLSEEVNAPLRAVKDQVPLTPEQQKVVDSLTTCVLVGLLPQSALEMAFATDTRIEQGTASKLYSTLASTLFSDLPQPLAQVCLQNQSWHVPENDPSKNGGEPFFTGGAAELNQSLDWSRHELSEMPRELRASLIRPVLNQVDALGIRTKNKLGAARELLEAGQRPLSEIGNAIEKLKSSGNLFNERPVIERLLSTAAGKNLINERQQAEIMTGFQDADVIGAPIRKTREADKSFWDAWGDRGQWPSRVLLRLFSGFCFPCSSVLRCS